MDMSFLFAKLLQLFSSGESPLIDFQIILLGTPFGVGICWIAINSDFFKFIYCLSICTKRNKIVGFNISVKFEEGEVMLGFICQEIPGRNEHWRDIVALTHISWVPRIEPKVMIFFSGSLEAQVVSSSQDKIGGYENSASLSIGFPSFDIFLEK